MKTIENGTPDDPGYARLMKFARSTSKIRREGVVFVSGVCYAVYPDTKRMICDKPAPEHHKLKELMADYGWAVFSHKLDDFNPEQMSFAESVVSKLIDH